MQIQWRFAGCFAALATASCGERINDVELSSVGVVASGEKFDLDSAPILTLTFTSSVDLDAIEGAGTFYSHADFCPYEVGKLISYGPYIKDKKNTYDWEIENPRRVNGRIEYSMAVRIQSPAGWSENEGKPGKPGRYIDYDLRKHSQDLCVKFEGTGYFITQPRTRIIRVPAMAIDQALREYERVNQPLGSA